MVSELLSGSCSVSLVSGSCSVSLVSGISKLMISGMSNPYNCATA